MEYVYSKKTLRKKQSDCYLLKRKMLQQFTNAKNCFEDYTISLDEYFYYSEERIGRLEYQNEILKKRIKELEAKL